MDKLSEQDRTIVYMHDVLGVPSDEIGTQLNLSRHAVDTRLWRARRTLAASIPDGEDGDNMPATKRTRMIYRCSFCDKGQDEVQRLIAGPRRVYICDQCVDLCHSIIAEEQSNRPDAAKLNVSSRHYPDSVQAFFADLPRDTAPTPTGMKYQLVHVEFMGQPSVPSPQQVLLLGQDSRGIVVSAPDDRESSVHFYPWPSIFRLTP